MAVAATTAAAAGSGVLAGGAKGGITLGTALSIAGTAIGALSALQGGAAQASSANLQAEILRQQAEQEAARARLEQRDFERDQSRLMARRRAALGATGVEPSSGSPLLVSEDFAAETGRQSERIRQGGNLRRTRLEQQATLFDREASNARTAGLLGAGTSLLAGGFRTARLLNPRFASVS